MAPTPAPRKLSRDHVAYLRGWLQGLESRRLWERYLGHLGPFDERRARTVLRELQLELGGWARRAGRPADAGLIGRHKNRITDRQRGSASVVPPTLEEFARVFPEDMYSEAELLELWTEAHGQVTTEKRRSATPAQRRARLLERQLRALDSLEGLACQAPQRSDHLSGWLNAGVSARLVTAGISTLGDLHECVGRWGLNWYKRVPRLGVRGAALITGWLAKQSAQLGALPSPALLPARQAAKLGRTQAPTGFGLLPLERLQVPPTGAAPDSTLSAVPPSAAQADLEIVQAWIALRPVDSNTWRAYRREAERLLLWSWFVAGKSLADLTEDDAGAYRSFLAAPGASWTGPRNVPRWSAGWRPFEGALSPSSAAVAIRILRSLAAWLVERGHLQHNPWSAIEAPAPSPAPSEVACLPDEATVQRWLTTLEPGPQVRRIRLILSLSSLGMTPSGIAAASVGQLSEAGPDRQWQLEWTGRSARGKHAVLSADLVHTLRVALADRGLRPDPRELPAATPLVGSLGPVAGTSSGLTAGRIYEIRAAALAACGRWQTHGTSARALLRAMPAETAPPAPTGATVGRRTAPSD